tara:strand:- start:20148 stop:22427 length:2280 start_codon:yes stop_codon:yes gene_type:complete
MINKTFIFLYVLVGLVPYLGAADKIHPQTLYISIINTLSVGAIIYENGFGNSIRILTKVIQHKQILAYISFLLLAIFSIFQSINTIQSLITIAEVFSQLFAFVMLIYFLSRINNIKYFFINVILILCSIELFSTLYPYLKDLVLLGYPINRSLEYRGVSGSVNIISYLLLMKLPFIYYFSIKNDRYRWVFVILGTLILYSIIVIHQTRSAILLSFLVTVFLYVCFLYNKNLENNKISQSYLKISLTIFLPLITAILLSNFQANTYDNRTENIQDRLSTINFEEYSTNARLRYYSQAIKSILKTPFLGVGIGNWPIVSIDTDKENIESYIIPYHVHNDFLEIVAETGIMGGILYYFIILSIFLYLLKKIIDSIRRRKPLGYELIFFTVVGIWIVDSMFNFPYARVLQQIHLFFILAVVINYYKFKPITINKKITKIFLIGLILCLPLVLYSSYRLYKSSIDQRIILSHYNLADYSLPLDVIDNMEMEYSDLTVTAIPMKSMKGFFYMKNGLYRDAIELFNEGTSHNPYLYFSESYKAFAFINLEELDSAYHYSKLAFDNLSGNVVHFANHALTLVLKKDSIALKNAYEKAKFKEELHDELYLSAMGDILDEDKNSFALENFEFDIQSDNDNLKRGYYTLKIGTQQMLQASQLNEMGDYYYEIGNYVAAEQSFKDASQINPYELPYQENYANAQLQIGKFDEAIITLNNLINIKGSESVKAKYMLVLAYLNNDKTETACEIISEIKDDPLVETLELSRFCN